MLADQSLRYFSELFRLFFHCSKCRRGEKISGTSFLSAYHDECLSILPGSEEISRICDSSNGREISTSQCHKSVRESLPKKATGNFLSFLTVSFPFFPLMVSSLESLSIDTLSSLVWSQKTCVPKQEILHKNQS